MTAETLSSNLVNYLVWRYLQEAGYADAAVHLSRNWIRNPQTLPFAKNIKPHTLTHLLQDGLFFDKLQAEATSSQRQYTFGHDHGPRYPAVRGGPVMLPDVEPDPDPQPERNGILADGPSKRGSRRKKKASHVDPQTNGDTLEVETNGIHLTSRGESEAIISEAESPVFDEDYPLVSTLNIGASMDMQTDKIAEITAGIMTIKVDDPESIIRKIAWSPYEDRVLLASGPSLLRAFVVPTSISPETRLQPVDIDIHLGRFDVTSFAWRDQDDLIVAALQEKANEKGDSMTSGHLIRIHDGGESVQEISSLEGYILCVKWNEASQRLLTVTATDESSIIKVWNISGNCARHTYLVDAIIVNAVWMSETKFAISGANTVKILEVDDSGIKEVKAIQATIKFAPITWDEVRYDPVCDIIACASTEPGSEELGIVLSGQSDMKTLSLKDDYRISGLDFQPVSNPASLSAESPRMIATSHEGGFVQLWDAKTPFQRVHRLEMPKRPAYAMAFSPDGFLLAAAGVDTVVIWNPEAGGSPKAIWKADSNNEWEATFIEEQDRDFGEHFLGWDKDGKKLAFTLGKQLAIINFQG